MNPIEGVIGHEYFHNWSGNRVTCRDWFQLSLKEGFTVFRDQEFSSDVFSRAKRIDDVNILRSHQFPEDNGPLAHPVRPDTYVEINNFYTMTVYNKGAEVVRMMKNLLGWEAFRSGCDLYFERHDGQAVTTDDFVAAMEESGNRDLTQFKRWYSQAGTPRIKVQGAFDPPSLRYILELEQQCPPTPLQNEKKPFVIPVRLALFSKAGEKLNSELLQDSSTNAVVLMADEHVIELAEEKQQFVFNNVSEPPIPSLLRGFSAPVILETEFDDVELATLAACDDDPFVRWDSAQRLACGKILAAVETLKSGGQPQLSEALSTAFRATLSANMEDQVFQAQALTLPSELWLAESMRTIYPDILHQAKETTRRLLALEHVDLLMQRYYALADSGAYRFDAAAAGRRALRNTCLHYLMALDDDERAQLCMQQYRSANNMTDAMAALAGLVDSSSALREEALDDYYRRWEKQPLVVDKWLRLQAMSSRPGTLERVIELTGHPAYNKENPNKVRALVGAFCHANQVHFHSPGGSGYRFLSQQVMLIDQLNPQVAARLVAAFNQWRRYDESRRRLMKAELERIQMQPGLSRDVGEIVNRSLAADQES